MKKFFLTLVLALCSLSIWAYDVHIGGIYYNLEKRYDYDSRKNIMIAEVTYGGEDEYYSGDIVIPRSITYCGVTYTVTRIGNSAFANCTGLTSVKIPNSVICIWAYAFENCTGLTSVTIPNSVTVIESEAFSGCTGLTSIIIPNSVEYIGNEAFYFCTGLTSVTIGTSVKNLNIATFCGCNLTSITNLATIPQKIDREVFGYEEKIDSENAGIIPDLSKITLYVPMGSVDDYKATRVWDDFNIVGISVPKTTTKKSTTTSKTSTRKTTTRRR